MSPKSSQLESLARRLAETREKEKELSRRMKKAKRDYEEAVRMVPPAPRAPAIRKGAEPRRRGAGIAHGDRREYREVMKNGTPEAPVAAETAEETLESRAPDYPSIRRTPLLVSDAQGGRISSAKSLPRAPYGTIGSVYGIESTIGDIRRERQNRRHPALRAFFAVGMVVLLSYILVRVLT